MTHESVVDQIFKSVSFEVEAVPNDQDVQASSTSANMTPMNVKIKIRKKHESDMERGIITVRKKPGEAPERIRLVNSDQTIISFGIVMETEFTKKGQKKPRRSFFGCLGTELSDEDDGPYVSSKNYNARHADIGIESKSDGLLKENFTLAKNHHGNTEIPLKKQSILGKCKPGGCLDPPFGEDKYSYKPSNKNNILLTNIPTDEIKEKSEVTEIVKKSDKMEVKENKNRDEIKEKCDTDEVTLQKNKRWKRSSSKILTKEKFTNEFVSHLKEKDHIKDNLDTKYGGSIITYPPEVSSSQKNGNRLLRTRKSIEKKQQTATYDESDFFYNPPKGIDYKSEKVPQGSSTNTSTDMSKISSSAQRTNMSIQNKENDPTEVDNYVVPRQHNTMNTSFVPANAKQRSKSPSLDQNSQRVIENTAIKLDENKKYYNTSIGKNYRPVRTSDGHENTKTKERKEKNIKQSVTQSMTSAENYNVSRVSLEQFKREINSQEIAPSSERVNQSEYLEAFSEAGFGKQDKTTLPNNNNVLKISTEDYSKIKSKDFQYSHESIFVSKEMAKQSELNNKIKSRNLEMDVKEPSEQNNELKELPKIQRALSDNIDGVSSEDKILTDVIQDCVQSRPSNALADVTKLNKEEKCTAPFEKDFNVSVKIDNCNNNIRSPDDTNNCNNTSRLSKEKHKIVISNKKLIEEEGKHTTYTEKDLDVNPKDNIKKYDKNLRIRADTEKYQETNALSPEVNLSKIPNQQLLDVTEGHQSYVEGEVNSKDDIECYDNKILKQITTAESLKSTTSLTGVFTKIRTPAGQPDEKGTLGSKNSGKGKNFEQTQYTFLNTEDQIGFENKEQIVLPINSQKEDGLLNTSIYIESKSNCSEENEKGISHDSPKSTSSLTDICTKMGTQERQPDESETLQNRINNDNESNNQTHFTYSSTKNNIVLDNKQEIVLPPSQKEKSSLNKLTYSESEASNHLQENEKGILDNILKSTSYLTNAVTKIGTLEEYNKREKLQNKKSDDDTTKNQIGYENKEAIVLPNSQEEDGLLNKFTHIKSESTNYLQKNKKGISQDSLKITTSLTSAFTKIGTPERQPHDRGAIQNKISDDEENFELALFTHERTKNKIGSENEEIIILPRSHQDNGSLKQFTYLDSESHLQEDKKGLIQDRQIENSLQNNFNNLQFKSPIKIYEEGLESEQRNFIADIQREDLLQNELNHYHFQDRSYTSNLDTIVSDYVSWDQTKDVNLLYENTDANNDPIGKIDFKSAYITTEHETLIQDFLLPPNVTDNEIVKIKNRKSIDLLLPEGLDNDTSNTKSSIVVRSFSQRPQKLFTKTSQSLENTITSNYQDTGKGYQTSRSPSKFGGNVSSRIDDVKLQYDTQTMLGVPSQRNSDFRGNNDDIKNFLNGSFESQLRLSAGGHFLKNPEDATKELQDVSRKISKPLESRDLTNHKIMEIETLNSKGSAKSNLKNDLVTLNLGFKSYKNDKKEKIFETFDTSKEPKDNNAAVTVIKAQIRSQMHNLRIPIDLENEMFIQIRRTKSPLKVQIEGKNEMTSTGFDKFGHSNFDTNIQDILNSIYERDLVPLQQAFKCLKQDIELLSSQKSKFRNRAIAPRVSKTIRVIKVKPKCSCGEDWINL